MSASTVVAKAINKRLTELREDCAVKRILVRSAFGHRFSGCPRANPEKPSSWDLHWEGLQAKAQVERPLERDAADAELAAFIVEHRPLMGDDWIGNDHGRLCWEPYLGGLPIDQHYCQREEGHEGNHADEWPETRWVAREGKGSWPQGVTGFHEWIDLQKKEGGEA
jgi:hypothetical protein